MILHRLVTATQFAHSQKVAQISGILAEAMGCPPAEAELITQAAAFHDIGKSSIPQAILNKPGPLTPEEFEIVKTHAAIGHQQIHDAVEILTVAALMCRDHHEWMDGTKGYIGLSGSSIHPRVRIVAASDVLDALISKRAYKSGWSVADIKEYFTAQSGRQFDPEVVKVLFSKMEDILALYKQEVPG